MAARQRELTRALRDRDLARARAALPDDFFYHDHRRMGPAASRRPTATSPGSARCSSSHPTASSRTSATWPRRAGARSASAARSARSPTAARFESLFVRISLQRAGEFVGAELFELEDLERARARFEELRPDPLRIPPNTATRFDERLRAVVEAQDWDGVGALVAEGATFEDRRRGVLLSGGRELLLTKSAVPRFAGRAHDHDRARDGGRPARAPALPLHRRRERGALRGRDPPGHRGRRRGAPARGHRLRPERPPRRQPRDVRALRAASDASRPIAAVRRVRARDERPRPRAAARPAASTTSSSTTTGAPASAASKAPTPTSSPSPRCSGRRPT